MWLTAECVTMDSGSRLEEINPWRLRRSLNVKEAFLSRIIFCNSLRRKMQHFKQWLSAVLPGIRNPNSFTAVGWYRSVCRIHGGGGFDHGHDLRVSFRVRVTSKPLRTPVCWKTRCQGCRYVVICTWRNLISTHRIGQTFQVSKYTADFLLRIRCTAFLAAVQTYVFLWLQVVFGSDRRTTTVAR